MTIFRILGSALLILALTAPSVRADDECILDEMQAEVKKELTAAAKAEKSGKPAEIFLAYRAALNDSCMRDKNIEAKYRSALPKLARDLAKAAEATGLLYSKEPLGTDGRTSAFAWIEASGDYNEANRVMLKAVHAKSDDLAFFKTAWEVDGSRPGSRDPKTDEHKPYASPAAYRQELKKIASANADRLMKAEEKDAAGLSGNSGEVGMASMRSMEKLRKASDWMIFLPDGDKLAKARAEQRGDTIMKRTDPMFTQMNAKMYYEFAGSSKAKEKLAQLDKKMEESGRAMEKASKKMEGTITESSAADQKKFKKGTADLEKELGF